MHLSLHPTKTGTWLHEYTVVQALTGHAIIVRLIRTNYVVVISTSVQIFNYHSKNIFILTKSLTDTSKCNSVYDQMVQTLIYALQKKEVSVSAVGILHTVNQGLCLQYVRIGQLEKL